MKYLVCTFITFSLFSTQAIAAQTSKEIWLEFSGTNDCEIGHCADGIPANILNEALIFYKKNRNKIRNDEYIAMADMTKKSTEKRLHILNLIDGSVDSIYVAHGINSETSLGMATKFSNKADSLRTSLGFYVTEPETFEGKNGESLRLNGLSKTNNNAYERGIIIHSAKYVSDEYIEKNGKLGNSEGCPAVSIEKIESVLLKLKGGALLYIYSNIPSLKWWQ
jgi:hypothetical protein